MERWMERENKERKSATKGALHPAVHPWPCMPPGTPEPSTFGQSLVFLSPPEQRLCVPPPPEQYLCVPITSRAVPLCPHLLQSNTSVPLSPPGQCLCVPSTHHFLPSMKPG